MAPNPAHNTDGGKFSHASSEVKQNIGFIVGAMVEGPWFDFCWHGWN